MTEAIFAVIRVLKTGKLLSRSVVWKIISRVCQSQTPNLIIDPLQLLHLPAQPQPWPGPRPQHIGSPPLPQVQISQPSTQLVHFPPVVVLKVTLEQGGGFALITHTHTHITDRHHTYTSESMQINPQAEPCYSINVPAPVISALVRSVSDDSETTSPFNWCHAPLLFGSD